MLHYTLPKFLSPIHLPYPRCPARPFDASPGDRRPICVTSRVYALSWTNSPSFTPAPINPDASRVYALSRSSLTDTRMWTDRRWRLLIYRWLIDSKRYPPWRQQTVSGDLEWSLMCAAAEIDCANLGQLQSIAKSRPPHREPLWITTSDFLQTQ